MKPERLEREFINQFQGGFPLLERPFKTLSERLDCSETTLIATLDNLIQKKILSRFGPLFDAARLGGGLTLAALRVPEERYDVVTSLVNAYPEVAHNYRRDHQLNMWFVLATETPERIDKVIQSIEQVTQLKVFNFPKKHEFFIGLWLHISEDGKCSTVKPPTEVMPEISDENKHTPVTLSQLDRKIIQQTQCGLPVTAEPYRKLALDIGITQTLLFDRLEIMQSSGIIRRIGAVPNHYKLGLTANGMTVWQLDESHLLRLGKHIGQLDFVSHCYQRPAHLPVWPYNFFAMVHGHNKDEVHKKTRQIASMVEQHCIAHETLFSSAILKKTGLRLVA